MCPRLFEYSTHSAIYFSRSAAFRVDSGNGHVGHDGGELGMRRAAVVALPRVFSDHLPVRSEIVGLSTADLRGVEAIRFQKRPDILRQRVESLRYLRQADENQAFEDPDVGAAEAMLGPVEVGRHQPRGIQTAVQVVHPGVVRADQLFHLSLGFLADSRPAVAAHIEQSMYGPVLVTDHNDGLAAHIKGEEIPGLRDAADVAREEPPAAM